MNLLIVPMDDIVKPKGITDCKKYKVSSKILFPGDTFVCTIKYKKGVLGLDNEIVIEEKITKKCKINTIITFISEDMFGLETGIGVIFGEDK